MSDWLEQAAAMPIAFSQVREDPRLDLAVLDLIGKPKIRGMMIASGGCTAAVLVGSGCLSHLHLVDMNPAQMALCRLKLHLLRTALPDERAAVMGHGPMPERSAVLSQHLRSLGLSDDALGSLPFVAEIGPDHVGRYELLFAQLRLELRDVADELMSVLLLENAAERVARVEAGTSLGKAMDRAFDTVMALPNLVRLFSDRATQNRAEPFSRHFARRTRHAIASLPTSTNPFLWQLLVGQFPPGVSYDWLNAASPPRWPEITETMAPFDIALAGAAGQFDLVHLSNILDWLSVEEARCTLELARRALVPGGLVFIRQLNSTLDIPTSGVGFDWLADKADELHARDRSFFYRRLHLGRKQ